MTTINIRADERLKIASGRILERMGLDMSTAIKLFLQQVVVTRSIPFPIRTGNGFTPKEEQAMLKDVAELESQIKTGTAKLYNSAEEMMEDILNEPDV
ncbi:MAG: type II toxin-antitoxin system RelB/DinJ family antitoxin [Candidatus Gracilibacteria bacterium]|jgi:DNA-damage-inducible protein J